MSSEGIKRQIDEQDHSRNLQEAMARAPDEEEKYEYLDKILETDISPASVRMLRNMTSKSFILSYMNDAQIHEIKALRKITLKKILAAHPDQKAIMKGELRTQVYNGNAADLRPLTQEQIVLIRSYIRASIADVYRAHEGFQQEEIGKVRTESSKKSLDEESGGMLPW